MDTITGKTTLGELPIELKKYLEDTEGKTTSVNNISKDMVPVLYSEGEKCLIIVDYILWDILLFLTTAPLKLSIYCEKDWEIRDGEWQKIIPAIDQKI